MLIQDTEKYPGGVMTGFILWISDRKRDFFKSSPNSFGVRLGTKERDANSIMDYNAWYKFVENINDSCKKIQ